jgi:hypothetical protein
MIFPSNLEMGEQDGRRNLPKIERSLRAFGGVNRPETGGSAPKFIFLEGAKRAQEPLLERWDKLGTDWGKSGKVSRAKLAKAGQSRSKWLQKRLKGLNQSKFAG